jgi:uncharacterized protein DUF3806
MDQKVEPLNTDDVAHLEAKRKWVREHYDETARHKYETLEGKLVLVETILRNKWIEPAETVKLQCLGIAFGDAVAQKLGLQWVAVQDEYGRDPALSRMGTSLLVFPMTSISKRIERGEEVDVRRFFEDYCETIEERARGWA